jgi:hypothetical protein
VPGTVRAPSEYVQHAKVGIDVGMTELLSMPLLVGLEVGGPNNAPRCSTRVATKAPVREDIPPVAQKPQQRRKDKPSRPLPTHGREDILTDADPPPGIGGSGPSRKRPVGEQPDHTLVQVGGSVDAGTGTKRRTRKVVLPAETGRPEASAEFARRVKNQFVLKGPRERTEGGRSPTPNVLGLSSVLEPSAHLSEYQARKSHSALSSLNGCSCLILRSSDTFSVSP